ncbi:hypothetical protein [Paraburkholderia nemoris]|uniref:hypothetical protein n=1 Tax=Paraburkholderia nemoris TaxID=2793076 RepID=UPI001B0C7C71|nr:hypothetical protein [Paraburkholderia nemoris]CAE6822033.1 hypothetical protein R75777_06196 [Paraburkholderia nemoris]
MERDEIYTRDLATKLQRYALLLEAEVARVMVAQEFSRDDSGELNVRARLMEQEVQEVRRWALILHDMKTNI